MGGKLGVEDLLVAEWKDDGGKGAGGGMMTGKAVLKTCRNVNSRCDSGGAGISMDRADRIKLSC